MEYAVGCQIHEIGYIFLGRDVVFSMRNHFAVIFDHPYLLPGRINCYRNYRGVILSGGGGCNPLGGTCIINPT